MIKQIRKIVQRQANSIRGSSALLSVMILATAGIIISTMVARMMYVSGVERESIANNQMINSMRNALTEILESPDVWTESVTASQSANPACLFPGFGGTCDFHLFRNGNRFTCSGGPPNWLPQYKFGIGFFTNTGSLVLNPNCSTTKIIWDSV